MDPRFETFYCPYLEQSLTKEACIDRQTVYPVFYRVVLPTCVDCSLGKEHIRQAREHRVELRPVKLQS